ncbi:SGNH/GDSL hydrolase family protein [Pelagicoccus enzymogenes]|uniref:SGNH/GDSL hydrolase family protein n=1 Tax=Pelagicoccus enzymogenes TaxID=2773457 RepID=UPI00280E23FD|nr:SGNH/GDSL hydrolase family protein [Pelagicoccus enzymogenes]MDQ8198252.1 SGNH/GDSL hydrolase family protein [Pelagicoccus enzymogenes]
MREKTILCFGDSNTWGCDPSGWRRFDRKTRWPGVLHKELGEGYHVVEEGLGGRTTVWDDPIEGHKNGYAQLQPLLRSHMPLDLLVIMLGTNDLKNRFSVSAMDVSWGMGRLIDLARANSDAFTSGKAEILVVCPPPFAPMEGLSLEGIFVGGEEKSRQLASAYRAICKERGIGLIDAGDSISSSAVDGIHLEASEHDKLGRVIAREVASML